MSIDFHCPYCNKLIKAPDHTGGKKGRCPNCKQGVYIPRPPDELDEFDLSPLDETEEQQRRQMLQEAVEVQRQAYGDKDNGEDVPAVPVPLPTHVDDVPGLVVRYVLAMSQSKLEDSERIVEKLIAHKRAAVKYIKKLNTDDDRPEELADIPEPLLQGFLKTLRNEL